MYNSTGISRHTNAHFGTLTTFICLIIFAWIRLESKGMWCVKGKPNLTLYFTRFHGRKSSRDPAQPSYPHPYENCRKRVTEQPAYLVPSYIRNNHIAYGYFVEFPMNINLVAIVFRDSSPLDRLKYAVGIPFRLRFFLSSSVIENTK